jgi:hypothetical protein
VTRLKSFVSSLVLSLAALALIPAPAFAQQQGYTGGSNPNSYTCNGGVANSTCMTPDISWIPLDTNGILQTSAAQLARNVNGSKLFFASVSQDVTLNTGGATTVTGNPSMLPAGSIILAVNGTVTVAITGSCTGWEFGDGTTAARFTSNNTGLTVGSSAIGINQWNQITTASAQPGQPAAGNITITCAGGAASAGKIRITTFYLQSTAPLP